MASNTNPISAGLIVKFATSFKGFSTWCASFCTTKPLKGNFSEEIKYRYYFCNKDFSGCKLTPKEIKQLYKNGIRDFCGIMPDGNQFYRQFKLAGCLFFNVPFKEANFHKSNIVDCKVASTTLLSDKVNVSVASLCEYSADETESVISDFNSFCMDKLRNKENLTAGEVAYLIKQGTRDFSRAIITGQCLDGMDLSYCDFSNADLTGTSLKNTRCYRTNFTNAKLFETNFMGSNCPKAEFNGTCYDAVVEDSFQRSMMAKIDGRTPETIQKSCWDILNSCYDRRRYFYQFFRGKCAVRSAVKRYVADNRDTASMKDMILHIAELVQIHQSSELSRSLSLVIKLLNPGVTDITLGSIHNYYLSGKGGVSINTHMLNGTLTIDSQEVEVTNSMPFPQ